MDADDWLKLDVLDKMYQIAQDHHVSLVRGNMTDHIGPIHFEDTAGWSNIHESRMVDVRKERDYIVAETPGIGNKLIKRELLDGLKFPEKTKWEDLSVMPVVVAESEKLFHMNEPIYDYRVHMNTTISDFIKKIPNVLDIIRSLDHMKKNMEVKGLSEKYQE